MDRLETYAVAGLEKLREIVDYWYDWIEHEKKEWTEKTLRP